MDEHPRTSGADSISQTPLKLLFRRSDSLEQESNIMRITVAHTKSKEEVMRAVDRSFDDFFQGIAAVPVKLVDEQRSWQGSALTFSVTAKMGLLRNRIKGTIDVTDKDLTIDVDLGLFERLISETKAREAIVSRARGLLT
jgi:hypothetical protein